MKKNYKSKIVLSLATLLSSSPLVARSADSLGISLGLVGVANIQSPSIEHNSASTSLDGQTTFGGGLTTEFYLQAGLSLEADLLYLQHEFNQKTAEFFGSSITSTFSSGHLQIPVLIRYRPIPFLSLGIGPYYSRVLTSWTVSASGQNSTTTNFGKNDYGALAAVGTSIPITGGLSASADIRYTRSFSETARSSGDAVKFSNLQIMAGLRFETL